VVRDMEQGLDRESPGTTCLSSFGKVALVFLHYAAQRRILAHDRTPHGALLRESFGGCRNCTINITRRDYPGAISL
jgi:hypothetical protein